MGNELAWEARKNIYFTLYTKQRSSGAFADFTKKKALEYRTTTKGIFLEGICPFSSYMELIYRTSSSQTVGPRGGGEKENPITIINHLINFWIFLVERFLRSFCTFINNSVKILLIFSPSSNFTNAARKLFLGVNGWQTPLWVNWLQVRQSENLLLTHINIERAVIFSMPLMNSSNIVCDSMEINCVR